MNLGIGEGKTREDHRNVADQLYASYAQGRDLRRLVSIIGEEALGETDRKYLEFADRFEQYYLSQGSEDREIDKTMQVAWDLLSSLPEDELKRINKEYLAKYLAKEEATEAAETEAAGEADALETAETTSGAAKE